MLQEQGYFSKSGHETLGPSEAVPPEIANQTFKIFFCYQSIYTYFCNLSLDLNRVPEVLLEPPRGQGVAETPIVSKGLKAMPLASFHLHSISNFPSLVTKLRQFMLIILISQQKACIVNFIRLCVSISLCGDIFHLCG